LLVVILLVLRDLITSLYYDKNNKSLITDSPTEK